VSETVVNYVVEARVPGKPWLTMQLIPENAGKPFAHKAYENWLASPGHLEYRLLRRTAVVTDEVLVEGRPGDDEGSAHQEGP
jgi:hypothetical protein